VNIKKTIVDGTCNGTGVCSSRMVSPFFCRYVPGDFVVPWMGRELTIIQGSITFSMEAEMNFTSMLGEHPL